MLYRLLLATLCCAATFVPTTTRAKDEFLLRSLLHFDDAVAKEPPEVQSDAPQPTSPVVAEPTDQASTPELTLRFYSTETQSWLPPVVWKSPENMRSIVLESERPHFVRIVRGDETLDAGFIDFHAVLKDNRQPIVTLRRRTITTVVPAGTQRMIDVDEQRSVEYPVDRTVFEDLSREITVTGADGKRQSIRVNYIIERPVTETHTRLEQIVKRVPETTTTVQVVARDVASFGVQEYLAGDQSLAPPPSRRAANRRTTTLRRRAARRYRIYNTLNRVNDKAKDPLTVWAYAAETKSWSSPAIVKPNEETDLTTTSQGPQYLRFLSGEVEFDSGYLDLAVAAKGLKEPLFLLERAQLKRFVPAGKEFTRWIVEPGTATREQTVMVPVMETRTKEVMNGSGQTKTVTYTVQRMVHETRTIAFTANQVRKVVRTAERDQTVDVEGLLVSVLRDVPADRKTQPPEMPKEPAPKTKRAAVDTIEDAVPVPPVVLPEVAPAPAPPRLLLRRRLLVPRKSFAKYRHTALNPSALSASRVSIVKCAVSHPINAAFGLIKSRVWSPSPRRRPLLVRTGGPTSSARAVPEPHNPNPATSS
ncbi:MAG: hypothetical protein QM811_22550 [Pirellulales bacterium]